MNFEVTFDGLQLAVYRLPLVDPKRTYDQPESDPSAHCAAGTVTRLAILWDPMEPARLDQVKAAEIAARELGLEVQLMELRGPDES